MDPLFSLQDILRRLKKYQRPVYQTILLLRPVGQSTYAWQEGNFFRKALMKQLTQVATSFLGTLLVALFSGVSVLSLATFLITTFLILLILNRVFGIEILVPKFSPYQA